MDKNLPIRKGNHGIVSLIPCNYYCKKNPHVKYFFCHKFFDFPCLIWILCFRNLKISKNLMKTIVISENIPILYVYFRNEN